MEPIAVMKSDLIPFAKLVLSGILSRCSEMPPLKDEQEKDLVIKTLREEMFQQTLRLTRMLLILSDVDQGFVQKRLDLVQDEDNLLPEEYMDLVLLTGLEDVLKVLPSVSLEPASVQSSLKEKLPASSPKALVKLSQEQMSATKEVSGSSDKSLPKPVRQPRHRPVLKPQPTIAALPLVSEEAPTFPISRGEKTRKILNRLETLGFFPKRARGRGSHSMVYDRAGRFVANVPHHTHLAPGTASNVQESVEAALLRRAREAKEEDS